LVPARYFELLFRIAVLMTVMFCPCVAIEVQTYGTPFGMMHPATSRGSGGGRSHVSHGLALATSLAGVARADQWTVPSVPWMLGDWGGLRTRLYEKGIDFQFGYADEFGTNTQGDVKRWAGYADQSQAGATFNLERLFGVKDAIFQVTFTERTGRNLVTDAQLNTLQLVQEVWGRGQTARLTQFWYDQHYLNDFISLKAGRMPVGGDFAAFGCDYQNLTFCGANIGNLFGNYIFNWPISQWAARIKFNFNGFGYFQVGAYDQNQQYLGYRGACSSVLQGFQRRHAAGRIGLAPQIRQWGAAGQLQIRRVVFIGDPARCRSRHQWQPSRLHQSTSAQAPGTLRLVYQLPTTADAQRQREPQWRLERIPECSDGRQANLVH
jgi:hypothetical protein